MGMSSKGVIGGVQRSRLVKKLPGSIPEGGGRVVRGGSVSGPVEIASLGRTAMGVGLGHVGVVKSPLPPSEVCSSHPPHPPEQPS